MIHLPESLNFHFHQASQKNHRTGKSGPGIPASFNRKLQYLLANPTVDATRLVVRQNYDSNDFETWRHLVKNLALPDATRHVSLLTQLLHFKFNPQTVEKDFNTETDNFVLPPMGPHPASRV